MSGYTRNQLVEYGATAVGGVIPLDKETVVQMVEYALDHCRSREAMLNYFTDLIGQDPVCLEFISKFQSMVFGDVSHSNQNKDHKPVLSKTQPQTLSALIRSSQSPSYLVKSSQTQVKKPQESKSRLTNLTKSTTTSQLLDKKPQKSSKASKKRTLRNLQDVESALAQLEIAPDHSGSRVCNCMGTRHPLFEFHPNCLNCGKIICSKEGLQPCSFCGHELLSETEKLQILNVLTMEKLELEGKNAKEKPKAPQKKKEKITISINAAGEHNLRRQDFVFKQIELKREKEAKLSAKQAEELKQIREQEEELKFFEERKDKDPELIAAQERLDKLLNFQSTGAERTKVIDRASDFDVPNGNTNLWASPLERALQLKKQQRQLRKQQELEKERSGRGRKVLDMTIRDGKVILREQITKGKPDENSDESDYVINSEDELDLEQIKSLQKDINETKSKQEAQKVSNYWDYEKDKSKWEKPVYMGDTSNLEASDTQTAHYNRVQLGSEETTEDTLIALPTL